MIRCARPPRFSASAAAAGSSVLSGRRRAPAPVTAPRRLGPGSHGRARGGSAGQAAPAAAPSHALRLHYSRTSKTSLHAVSPCQTDTAATVSVPKCRTPRGSGGMANAPSEGLAVANAVGFRSPLPQIIFNSLRRGGLPGCRPPLFELGSSHAVPGYHHHIPLHSIRCVRAAPGCRSSDSVLGAVPEPPHHVRFISIRCVRAASGCRPPLFRLGS